MFSQTSTGAITAGLVPDGTCRAKVVGLGGGGASSGVLAASGGVGAAGAQISATFAVLPGQSYGGSVAGGGTVTAGGVGGGGAPGTIVNNHRGGGGGGRTEVRLGGLSVLVAGGGGGGGAAHQLPLNGNGGPAGLGVGAGIAGPGSDGVNGIDNPSSIVVGGGKGGAAAAGGAGGVNSSNGALNGLPGGGVGTGTGGNGGPDQNYDSAGGGGAGYTGGGGGASTVNSGVTGAGGGGGSSFVVAASPTPSGSAPTAISGVAGPPTASGSGIVGAAGSATIDFLPCLYDLALTKTVSPSPVYAGSTATWTITLKNNGPDPMTKGDTVDLADTLPAGPNGPATPAYKVLSVGVSGGANADMSSGAFTCSGVTVGSSMPASTNCSRAYAAPGAPEAPSGGLRGLNVGETLTITYEQQIASSAPCPAVITNTATVKDRPSSTGTSDVTGVTVTDSAARPLSISCVSVTKLTLVKALSGSRLVAADQFTMAISPSGVAPSGSSVTTAGSGATVTASTGVVAVASATPGLAYTFSESMAAGSTSVLSQYRETVSCVNTASGSPTVLPATGSSAVPFAITPTLGDDITCTLTNAPLSSSLTIVKSTTSTGYSAVGASIPYSFVVRNTGQTTLGSITITDPKASGISCPSTTLAPGASTTCTATHAVTQADLDAGSVVNTATVTGAPAGGSNIPAATSNTVTVTAAQSASLTIAKSTTQLNYATVGQSILYSFTVRNTGNVTLTSVTVTDAKVTAVSCGATTLAPGISTICSGTHVVTQADLDAGSIVNTASVVGTPPTGPPTAPLNSNTVTVPATTSPSLSVQKSSATTSYATVGQSISYSLRVTNTGNVSLTSITVSDPKLTGISCPTSSLAPGVFTTCTGTHSVTQADLDAGSIINTASAVGTPPSGPALAPTSSNTLTIPSVQSSGLTITKSTVRASYSTLGESVPYSFVVRNTGNVTLTAVTVSDPKVTGLSCPVSTLAPGVSTTCTGNHIVTQADLDGGTVVNTASVTGTPPSGTPLTPVSSNTVTLRAAPDPQITVAKSTTKTSFASVGEQIPYSFIVRNTGNVTLSSIAVSDAKTTGVSCPVTTLAPGLSTTCSGTHTITQADLDLGSVVNTASVTATPPSGPVLASVSSNTITVPAAQSPSLSVVKSTTRANFTAAGQTVPYTIVVKNTGNVTLHAVTVSDPKLSGLTCDASTLAPGASSTCTGSHVTTNADVAAAPLLNTASAVATPPTGPAITPVASNTVSVPLAQQPSLTITKSTATSSFASVGTVIVYSFDVSNTGNVALTALSVTDANATGITCPTTSLAVGQTTTCTGTHTTTQTDLDTGSIVNTAQASATPPSGAPLAPVSSNTVTIPASGAPSLTVTKATTTSSVRTVGTVISYSFTVRNTGNVTLTSIQVTDPNATGISCPTAPLAPGASVGCTGTHAVTQADLDAGAIINTASATGTPPSGSPLAPVASNTVTVPVTQAPTLTIVKATSTTGFNDAGQVISYTFQVTNSGNVTLHAIVVSDPNAIGITCPASTLAPSAATTCTGTHTSTQADLDAGSVVNTAAVVGMPPSGPALAPTASNTVTVPGLASPALSIVKSTTTPSYNAPGQSIPYSFVVTNSGNVTMTAISVSDPIVTGISCAPSTLSPSQTASCSGTYLTTQSDVDAGAVVNRARVSGNRPGGLALTPVDSNTVTVPASQSPRLTIVKSTTKTSVTTVGEAIAYRFHVTNAGNVNLTAITVTDAVAGAVSCSPTALAPGQSVDCTATHVVTQSDLDAGSVVNTASVVGSPPSGPALAPVGSNTVTVPAVQNTTLTIVKSTTSTRYATLGEQVPYSFALANVGNITLTGVTVADPKVTGLSCASTTLAPGGSTTCTGTHAVTQGDLDAGSVVNTATVTGTSPKGVALAPVSSNTVTVPAAQSATLTIVKSTTATGYAAVGDRIAYFFDITNTGNVTMSSVTVTDAKVAGVSCPAGSLAPGATMTCSGTHSASQADLDAGSIMNTATVVGTPPGGSPIAPVPSNTVTVNAGQAPSLTLSKATSVTSFSTVNETVTYTFTVTNTGNVTVTAVRVSDPQVVGLSCGASILAPGTSTTCGGTHLVSQANLDANAITNTASVVATPPSGTPLVPVASNTVVIPAVQSPALTISKATATGSYKTAGTTVGYTFQVVNTGNVTLTAISIVDPQLTGFTCNATALAGGASTMCSGVHTVVQADVDAGSIVNTASVTGTPPSGAPIAPVSSNTVTVPAIQTPMLTIAKATTATTFAAVVDSIPYSFTVQNTGNVTMSSVVVSDPQVQGLSCPSTSLTVNATMVCTATHAVTLADLNLGFVANTASVVGTPPSGPAINPVPSNTVTVVATVVPGLSALKSDSGAVITKAGGVVSYSVLVTNTGNVTMSLVKVDDPQAPGLSCPVTVLDPGATTTCTGTHRVTQAEADAGVISNTAFVTGKPPVGAPIAPVPSNTVTVAITADPHFTIAKATAQTSVSSVGDPIVYTFNVANTGNVTMRTITPSDPQVSGLACLVTTLAPAQTTVCTGTHTVTQADLDAGSVINTATVVGTPPSGPAIAPVTSNTVTVPATQSPSILVVKSTTTTSVAVVNTSIPYAFVVTNNGNVSLHGVTVADPNASGITCPFTTLAPGASVTCTATHSVTQADLDAGSVINTAHAVGTPPTGPALAPVASNTVTVPVATAPGLSITKTAGSASYAALLDVVPYSFTVTNTGNVSMSSIRVSDPLTGPVTCLASTLAPTIATTCTGSHTVTQADLDRGSIVNTAAVVGTPPSGPAIAPVSSNTMTVPAVQSPSLTISKSTTSGPVTSVRDVVPYRFVVTNTGNVTITAIAIADPLVPVVSCPATALAPAASVTCTGTHQVTQADVDGGSIVNTASVAGVLPSGTALTPTASNTVTVPATPMPAITILKSTTNAGIGLLGEVVTYTFTVRNAGNVTLAAVQVNDRNATGITCAASRLAPGAQTTCTGTHIVTLGDLNTGALVNTASVTAVTPSGVALTPVPSNTVTLPATQRAALSISKATNTAVVDAVGQRVPYTFTVTNVGNVTITGIAVADPNTTTPTCAASQLDPGEQTTCTATHTVRQDDITNGSVVNMASVTGSTPDGQTLPPIVSNTITIPATQRPRITVVKSTKVAAFRTPGEVIAYQFVVTNAGNVPVSGVRVADPITGPVICAQTILAPGASTTCSASHTVNADDVRAGIITNVASLTAVLPGGAPIGPIPSNTVELPLTKIEVIVPPTVSTPTTLGPPSSIATTTVVPVDAPTSIAPPTTVPAAVKSVDPAPAEIGAVLHLTKTASATFARVGDTVDYHFVMTNRGATPLTDVRLTDDMVGLSAIRCPAPEAPLAPGASISCTATYTVTADDVARGSINNTASAQGAVLGCEACGKTAIVKGASTARSYAIANLALSFTGSDARRLTLAALLTVLSGFALLFLVGRRRRHRA